MTNSLLNTATSKMQRTAQSMRILLLAAMAPGLFLLQGCSDGNAESGNGGNSNTVFSGEMAGCMSDSMRLYRVKGPDAEQVAAAAMENKDGKSTFRLELAHPGAGFYMLGINPGQAANVVLDQPVEVTVTGNCQNAKGTFAYTNAVANDEYQTLLNRVISHNQRVQQLMQNLQIFSQTDPNQVPRLQQDLQAQNTRHFAYLDSVVAKGGYIGKLATLYNFKPFMSDPSHQQYGNEIEYFRQAFFAGLDMNDPEIAHTPQMYEKARAYAQTMGSRIPRDQGKSSMDGLLQQADGGPAYKSILKGFLNGLEAVKSDLYLDYGKTFMDKFPQDPQAIAIQNRIQSMQRLAVGAEAPDISEKTPQGASLALSDLRGKVVLLDFWASWCRPCRMENPNVVKAYNKYKSAGFEILGVSLDKTRDKWLQAIDADGLTWKHISDLGGWGSRPAQTYGVNSIPATFLVDREGKIMARNLRGPALESKLEEIFGF